MWTRDCSCDILAKNVAAFFWPCLKGLPEVKVKIFGLNELAKEISKQFSIDCHVWLLMAILIKICNKKEQDEQGK